MKTHTAILVGILLTVPVGASAQWGTWSDRQRAYDAQRAQQEQAYQQQEMLNRLDRQRFESWQRDAEERRWRQEQRQERDFDRLLELTR